jgi:hypothetical protein
MTPAQLATFKAAILADANLTAALSAGEHGTIAAYYNAAGTGLIWRPSISVSEVNTAVVWADFAVLSALLQNTYMAMIQGGLDATSSTMRNGFTTVFGAGSPTQLNLIALARRVPTRFEALFTTASVTTVYGYIVSVADVAAALGS